MSSALEERYRSVLRVLPASYRAVWEEEMVATFLESMRTSDPEEADYLADFGRPGWSELISVLALAVRLRLPVLGLRPAGSGAPSRHQAWGDAIRVVALIGLLSQAVTASIGLGNLLWLAGKVPGLPAPHADSVALAVGRLPAPHADSVALAVGRLPAARVLLEFTAVPAYLALLNGRWRVARALASLGVATVAVAGIVDLVDIGRFSVSRWSALLVDVFVVLALWAFHRDSRPPRRRPWLAALPVGIVLVEALVVSTQHPADRLLWLDWSGLCCAALVAAAVGYLVREGLALRRPDRVGEPAWPLAIALLGLVLLGERMLTLPEYVGSTSIGQRSSLLTFGTVEALAVLAVTVPLAILARRRLLPVPAAPEAVLR